MLVSGGVQGVGYRWYCREEAMAAGLAGSVRNLPDGRVEAFFEGSHDGVEALLDWCRHGPRMAAVSGIEVEELDPVGDDGFAIGR